MNIGYTYSDMKEIKRVIVKHISGGISGGLLLDCNHEIYFGNPYDFKVGDLIHCHQCPFEDFKFKIIENPEINVSDDLRVSGHHLKDDKWSNN